MSISGFQAQLASGQAQGVVGRVRRLMAIEDPDVLFQRHPDVMTAGWPQWHEAGWPQWHTLTRQSAPIAAPA